VHILNISGAFVCVNTCMFITDPEIDFWPWHWIHGEKKCENVGDIITAWKTIDPSRDTIFNTETKRYANSVGDPMSTDIAEGISCHMHKVDASDKISLRDYQQYAIEKFGLQMQKIVNRNGKIFVGLSGGIDCTMTLGWLVKNKVDFETFVIKGDTWRGYVCGVLESEAIKMTEMLGVKNNVIDYRQNPSYQHTVIKHYCLADEYDVPTDSLVTGPPCNINILRESFDVKLDGMLVAPIGTDDLFLHRNSSFARFIPDKMLKLLQSSQQSSGCIFDYGYKVGVEMTSYPNKYDNNSGIQLINGYADDLLLGMHNGTLCSPASSKEWFEMWHRIDNDSCSYDQLQDLMGVGWLKRQISEWVGEEISTMSKHSPCTEKWYEPDESNRKFIISECEKIKNFYRESSNSFQQLRWANTIEIIKTWNKVSPGVVQSIHTLNWLFKNR
jgi:hypothetical protein